MSSIYDDYAHLKCDDPNCNGYVTLVQRPINSCDYECNLCGKKISYHYVSTHADTHFISDETGWIFPMVRKRSKEKK